MAKMKTKSSAKKRFKVSATGKIKRSKGGKSHLLSHKSRKRKRNLLHSTLIDKGPVKLTKECLPYA